MLSVLIAKNTNYPVKVEKEYTNSRENQTVLRLQIYQGQKEKAVDNEMIGDFELDIPPMPVRTAKIIVAFEIDQNGILNVTAQEESQEAAVTLEI